MRICKNCGHSIRICERWRVIHRVFWFFRLADQYAHHNCLHPQEGPKTKRIPGEVPLPFPEPSTSTEMGTATIFTTTYGPTSTETGMEYHSEGFTATPAQELANIK